MYTAPKSKYVTQICDDEYRHAVNHARGAAALEAAHIIALWLTRALWVLLLALLLASCAQAQPASIGAHLYSYHSARSPLDGHAFNNTTPGLNLTWANGFSIGGYRNSQRNADMSARYSYYVGYSLMTERQAFAGLDWSAGATIALATGYWERKIQPTAMLVGSAHVGATTFSIGVAPDPTKNPVHLVHFMVSREI